MDLISVSIPIRYAGSAEDLLQRPIPLWWGRAVQTAFLSIIRRADPPTADWLHQENEIHPYTVSSLIGLKDKEGLSAEKIYRIRFTALTSSLTEMLHDQINKSSPLINGGFIMLDYLPFTILSAQISDQQIRIETQNYTDLLSNGTAKAENPGAAFKLLSPTLFRSEEKNQPIPLPHLSFRSFLEKWNTFSPMKIPQAFERYARETIISTGFSLRSERVQIKDHFNRVGAVGTIRYRSLNTDPYWVSLMHTLADYSYFCGAGIGTSFGLGQIQPL